MTNEREKSLEVVIIGGGYCGALVAVQLIRQHRAKSPNAPLSIKVVKGSEKLARGAAYGTTCPFHLLNVPVEGMSALADEPQHFLDWIWSIYPGASAQALVSRSLYGDYVQQLLGQTVREKSQSVQFEIVSGSAIAVAPSRNGEKASILFQSGERLSADKVVLALGNFLPNESALGNLFLSEPERVHKDPWAADALKGIGEKDSVLLIGTGLTMIDVAVQLRSLGHSGRIMAVSRHGLLPQAHRFFHRLENVPAASELVPDRLPVTVSALFKTIRKCALNAPDWRLVINALRPRIQSIWQSLDAVERRRFLRHVRPVWEVLRHRVAPELSAEIEVMRQDGKLSVIAGRVTEMRSEQDWIEVVIKPRSSRTRVGMSFHHVINCTGPATDLRTSKFPLVANLRSQNLIRPDALGLGIDVDESGAVLQADGSQSSLLFAIGSLLKGKLWETTAVPELRVQALQLAQTLLAPEQAVEFAPAATPVDVPTL